VRQISYPNLVVIIGKALPGGSPFGESAYGLWLHHWFLLKYSNQALINTHYMGREWEVAELDRLRSETEQSVITGASSAFFDERKEGLKDEVERKIFPVVFGEDFEAQDWWPELVWLN
jgi:hypothetical protein